MDVSVAVATDKGLITPIIRNAHTKGLLAISQEIRVSTFIRKIFFFVETYQDTSLSYEVPCCCCSLSLSLLLPLFLFFLFLLKRDPIKELMTERREPLPVCVGKAFRARKHPSRSLYATHTHTHPHISLSLSLSLFRVV